MPQNKEALQGLVQKSWKKGALLLAGVGLIGASVADYWTREYRQEEQVNQVKKERRILRDALAEQSGRLYPPYRLISPESPKNYFLQDTPSVPLEYKTGDQLVQELRVNQVFSDTDLATLTTDPDGLDPLSRPVEEWVLLRPDAYNQRLSWKLNSRQFNLRQAYINLLMPDLKDPEFENTQSNFLDIAAGLVGVIFVGYTLTKLGRTALKHRQASPDPASNRQIELIKGSEAVIEPKSAQAQITHIAEEPAHVFENISEFAWPTEVTPDILAQIDAYRASGNSIASSVARYISREANQLYKLSSKDFEDVSVSPFQNTDEAAYRLLVEVARRTWFMNLFMLGYSSSANAILSCEEFLRNINPTPNTGIPEFGKIKSVLEEMGIKYAKLAGTEIPDYEAQDVAASLDEQMRSQLFTQKFIRMSVEEFVGFCTEYEKKRQSEDGQIFTLAYTPHISFEEALERGQERFLQLYHAINQPI